MVPLGVVVSFTVVREVGTAEVGLTAIKVHIQCHKSHHYKKSQLRLAATLDFLRTEATVQVPHPGKTRSPGSSRLEST